jgi:hydrophobic/amphiphilic exporter-1 (mainly G- bacteria), HAE1 family
MFISDFAIRRPIITVVTIIALVVFGVTALTHLDTDEFPEVANPVVFVGIAYPGASPDIVEREVVTRLEDQMSGISGVDKINSSSTDGFAQITVQFEFSKPIDEATQDIRDAISAVRSQLPAEILEPVIQHYDPNSLPIVSLALTSTTMTTPQLTQVADEQIGGDLRGIQGVAEVNVVGGDSAQLNINVRPKDLAALGVGIDQVVNAVRAQNLAAPVGNVTTALEQRSIRLQGRLDLPTDFSQLVVSQRGGTLITLGQVADVSAGAAEPTSAAMYNGGQAIGLDIVKSRDYSTTAVSDAIRARIASLEKTLPVGTRIEIVRDAGTRVRASVENVEDALVEGAFLTVLVVFLFLNSWRSTVITGLALPVSALASFVPLLIWGFTLNTMSLLGLSLAIGILIDDAIVVRENIVRHVELGVDHMTAAHEGTDEIGLAVTATTFSIVAVFVPVAFMPGVAGQWFKPFALTIACAVLVSLFVSFSLDPMLSAYWADPQLEAHERRNPIARALDAFNVWFNRQADRYKVVIGWALDHRWIMGLLAVASFVGAIVLQATIGGFGFVPVTDNSELYIAVETPPGSSLDYTSLKAQEVARIVRTHSQVAYTYTTVGGAVGSGDVTDGTVYARLLPKSKRHVSQEQLGQMLRGEMNRIGGVTAYTYDAGFGGNLKPLQLLLQGPDQATLGELAQTIEQAVVATPGAVDVGLSTKGDKPELNVVINRGLAGSLGITVNQLAQSLRPAFAGVNAGTWVDPGDISRYVVVRLSAPTRENAEDLANLPVVVSSGLQAPLAAGSANGFGGSFPGGGLPSVIPLGQIATITPSVGPAEIDHYNRSRVVTIGANIEGSSLGQVSDAVMKRVNQIRLPVGYHITSGGQVEDQNQVFGSIFTALGIAVMLMYLILVVQFGSFLDPIAILISLPLSLIGVVLALLITGDTLNLMSLIGVILLMGIVAKNAILLIDFAKWARVGGKPIREALIEAGRIRLRPILMTTSALVAGMIPVAMGLGEGADFRAPLGRAVIGGVITSTVLTLIVIPTVYETLDEWRTWMGARFGRRSVTVTPKHSVAPTAETAD